MNSALHMTSVKRVETDGKDMSFLHSGGTQLGILAVKDEQSLLVRRVISVGVEQFVCKRFTLTMVHRTINVAALILILEATVNDHGLIEDVTVLSIKHI